MKNGNWKKFSNKKLLEVFYNFQQLIFRQTNIFHGYTKNQQKQNKIVP
jgi:hypothetical protein